MNVWSIQPVEVLNEIEENREYVCDCTKSSFLDDWNFKEAYDWLVNEMEDIIGKKPDGVKYPVWAWYARNFKNKKPDLRESGYGIKCKKLYCIELDIPVERLVFSDFNEWHCVLNKFPLFMSNTDKEYDIEYAKYMKLSNEEKEKFMKESWKNIFNITPFKNEFRSTGEFVQATFWKLYKDDIVKVQPFVCR